MRGKSASFVLVPILLASFIVPTEALAQSSDDCGLITFIAECLPSQEEVTPELPNGSPSECDQFVQGVGELISLRMSVPSPTGCANALETEASKQLGFFGNLLVKIATKLVSGGQKPFTDHQCRVTDHSVDAIRSQDGKFRGYGNTNGVRCDQNVDHITAEVRAWGIATGSSPVGVEKNECPRCKGPIDAGPAIAVSDEACFKFAGGGYFSGNSDEADTWSDTKCA